MNAHQAVYRDEVRPGDAEEIRRITRSSSFFSEEEIGVAVELVEERLARGIASGYHFLLAEEGGKLVGYACFGPIAGTKSSFDLFWIAVDRACRGRGLGSEIMRRSEERIARMGGTRIYAETSSRAQYEPTRAFYLARGYRREAVIEDFYAPGDSKVIFVKTLEDRTE